ncbi:type II toxin-antitoxin system VapC family toxin [Thermus antranikianii]|uniref:Type II toxin-antitoxin system VapC family toxin n=2 Tax=Thermus TaxID=270 RepID=A0A7V4E5R7_9DEIN|nr:type II toxin-antitoxin system VapC family toxin [Thermus antranikianii]QWK22046.1 MAG: type II toxin-antitoxin system VapC family toxin [Thermus antranikianii]WCM39292.1 PIN domain-containing protein [Thermus antranikianii]
MISLDTNIILSALDPQDAQHEKAVSLLDELSREVLFISPPVYAELRAGQGWPLIAAFLEGLGIRLRPEMPLPIWELAGERFGLYAQKRRKTSLPRRILADFLVGSHALYHGLSLATFDPGPYRLAFPELEVVP